MGSQELREDGQAISPATEPHIAQRSTRLVDQPKLENSGEIFQDQGQIILVTRDHGDEGLSLFWEQVPDATGYTLFLSPQPSHDGLQPDSGIMIAELAKDATTTSIKKIAPGAHVFFTLVAKGLPSPVWGATHVHVLRTAEARSRSPLGSYHLVGPGILALVFDQGVQFDGAKLDHNLGADWQSGKWTIRRANGQEIAVRDAYRRSSSHGLEHIKTGYGVNTPHEMRIEHRIYLDLAQAIGSQEVLSVVHEGQDESTRLDLILPLSDLYTETPTIQVNQVGYNPAATTRYAYLSQWLGDGGFMSLTNFPEAGELLIEDTGPQAARSAGRRSAGSLKIRPRIGSITPESEVRELDLRSVPAAEGIRYRIRIPGVGVSVPTAVSNASVRKAFKTLAAGLYHMRRCQDFKPGEGAIVRPSAHCDAVWTQGRRSGFFPTSEKTDDLRPLAGGHYDAGDFDIRRYHVLVAQYLLRAFENTPKKFGDGQFHPLTRTNGVPDLLDEALHSLLVWEGLQDPDGGVRLGIESTRHPWGYYYAHEEPLVYFTYDADPHHSALVAGLFAQAAFLVQPFDAQRAAALETAAKKSYTYAKSHGAADEYLLYPAGELARLTGGAAFGADFLQHWKKIDRYGNGAFDHLVRAAKIYPGSFSKEHPAMIDYVMGYLGAPHASPEVLAVAKKQLGRIAAKATEAIIDSPWPHRSAVPKGIRPDWGQFVGQGRHLDGAYQLGALSLDPQLSQTSFDAMSLAADYVLGCNPASMSYITGLGTHYPQQPLHLDSLAAIADGKAAVPGIAVFGPVFETPKASYYFPVVAGFYPAFGQQPLSLRYADSPLSVTTNEFSVWETQAPMVLLFASLLPEAPPPAADPP